MGMDVYGTAPTGKQGEYFRRSAWGWRSLADLMCELAPNITAACQHWQTNDGDGLDAAGAVLLADALDVALADGSAACWIAAHDAAAAAAPNRACTLCHATGVRRDNVGDRMAQHEIVCKATTAPGGLGAAQIPHPRAGEKGWCNGCDGRGWNEAWEKAYHVDVDDVREFAAFARASGGFRIL